MTHKVEAELEFAIGDIVYHKVAPHQRGMYPQRGIIVEQIVQICPGGIQLHYEVQTSVGASIKSLEHCLTRERPEYDPVVEQNEEHHSFHGWANILQRERPTDEQRKAHLAKAKAETVVGKPETWKKGLTLDEQVRHLEMVIRLGEETPDAD